MVSVAAARRGDLVSSGAGRLSYLSGPRGPPADSFSPTIIVAPTPNGDDVEPRFRDSVSRPGRKEDNSPRAWRLSGGLWRPVTLPPGKYVTLTVTA